jgi:hypothetical protein
MRKKKAAPLTGSLLTQDKTDSSTGFVISLVDRLKEAQTAADAASEQPNRKAKSARDERASGADPSVDIVDSVRPKPVRRKARVGSESDGHAAAKAAPTRPSAPLGEADATSEVSQLVQALRNGDLEQAESVFGRLTGLNAGHVRRVLYGAEGRNLAIACRALGIEQLQFVSIFMLSRRLGLGEKALEPRRLTHIAGYFDQTDEAAARRTLNQWLCYSGD